MSNKILTSTGAFLGVINHYDQRVIKTYAPQIHADAFELMSYPHLYEDEDKFASDILESKVEFPVIHLDKKIGDIISRNESGDTDLALEMLKVNCRLANRIGAKIGVLHLWGGMPSDQHIEHNISLYPALLKIANQHSITLAIENIPCNKCYNPFVHWESLYALYPESIKFTLDTRFIHFHGLWDYFYDAKWLWDKNVIAHIHISDWIGEINEWERLRYAMPIGKGNIDFIRFLNYVKSQNYQGNITLECSGRVGDKIDINVLNDCVDYVRMNF